MQSPRSRVPSSPLLLLSSFLGLLILPAGAAPSPAQPLELPWAEAGLSEREAAAHLLDRFAFGARPGDVDRVVQMGLESWLEAQLAAALPEPELEGRLAPLHALQMSAEAIQRTYPPPGVLLNQMRRRGGDPDDPGDMDPNEPGAGNRDPGSRARMRAEMARMYDEKGYRPQRELIAHLLTQKLYRAVYAENQLQEVLTDFWFNHFNVSLDDNQARSHLLSYERDAIRPHCLGDFDELLLATAQHPAMLLYLDNTRSRADAGRETTLEVELRRQGVPREMRQRMENRRQRQRNQYPDRPRGLNENYARELLELHTLGVDGGYGQEDVIEVARAFTGWMALPPGDDRRRVEELAARARGRGRDLGFVRQGEFLFNAEAHDAEKKVVLGKKLAAGRGIEDGLDVLALLSRHPSTTRHLAHKLAVRFVADEPDPALVERLADEYRRSDGNIAAVMRALAASPEFWSDEARRRKIKSPFELATSALRALDAEVTRARALVSWIERMGQPLYAYQAPTGYPDRASAWVNTGALLNRMNFGLQLAAGQVSGVAVDLAGLNDDREPESVAAALETYGALLLPERDLTETLRLLGPMTGASGVKDRVEALAGNDGGAAAAAAIEDDALTELEWGETAVGEEAGPAPVAALQQVVGLLLGSPEFQRR